MFETVISILWLPFKLLEIILGKQNYLPIDTNSWTSWCSVNGQDIERNLVGETGFDGVIKFYRLRTSDEQINRTLQGKIFGEFHCETNYGLFLREFKTLDDWPTSYLIFVDKENYTYRRLQKTVSSWTDWKYEFINDSDFNIITEPADTYTKRIKITATNKMFQ